jgi:flavin reductase (DIM6/NTAB) family NADH-FMN oxidoreductase RutF
MVSGREEDKAILFETFYGQLGNVPMIKECPVCLECQLIKEFSIQHRQVFIGEVVETYIDEEYVVEKEGRKIVSDLGKLDPVIYSLDNRYYRIGEMIGTGYLEGRKIKA